MVHIGWYQCSLLGSTSCSRHAPLGRNVKRFRRGLVFKAHRLLYHSTLGWRVIKKKKTRATRPSDVRRGLLARMGGVYRGTSLIRNSPPLGPCSRPMPRALWWS